MKNLLCILLIVIFIAFFVGCGSSEKNNANSSAIDNSASNTDNVKISKNTNKIVNEKVCIVNENGKDVYFGFEPMILDDDGTISVVDVVDKYGKKITTHGSVVSCAGVYDGNNIYFSYDHGLGKYSYQDGDYIKSIWVVDDLLKENEILNNKTGTKTFRNIENLQNYGEYVYFNKTYDMMNINETLKSSFRIGKISKDGNSIEMLSDKIKASAYTISDDWIYYFDNGFNYSSDIDYDNHNFSSNDFSQERVGLYRTKVDGSNIEKIYDDFDRQKDEKASLNIICKDIKVVGDYIYFIDYSKNGKGRVCRVNIDGSDYQVISKNSAYFYTFNNDKDIIYYVSGPSLCSDSIYEYDNCNVYENKINDNFVESELMKPIKNDCVLQYYNNCLYVSSNDLNIDDAGQRYNFDKSKMEVIHSVQTDSSQEQTKYQWVN